MHMVFDSLENAQSRMVVNLETNFSSLSVEWGWRSGKYQSSSPFHETPCSVTAPIPVTRIWAGGLSRLSGTSLMLPQKPLEVSPAPLCTLPEKSSTFYFWLEFCWNIFHLILDKMINHRVVWLGFSLLGSLFTIYVDLSLSEPQFHHL